MTEADDGYVPTRRPTATPERIEEYFDGYQFYRQCLPPRYDIVGASQGGFGIVLFVIDRETNEMYAVKTYKPAFRNVLVEIEAFKEEAEFWISLEPHPNLVRAHFLEVFEEMPFLFMEYIPGAAPSLRERMVGGRRLNLDFVVRLLYQMCLGMEHANRHGEVAHLDLKPENILITPDNIVKITDFGLAHRVRLSQGEYPKEQRGSWPYAPPERFLDQAEDSRSDMFSLGIITYEMLTGGYPYPFRVARDPVKAYEQFCQFHADHGLREVTHNLYYEGMPGVDNRDISILISGYLQDYAGARPHSFTQMSENLSATFKLVLPEYLAVGGEPHADLRARARSLARIGRYGEALNVFNRLMQETPGDASLWVEAAHVLAAVGDADTARDFCQRALHIDPEQQRARDLLGSLD